MRVDTELLSSIYMERLQSLRSRAEESGISKSGSVEVLRARLISNLVLPDMDLSWEGIQSMPHKEIGEVLKVFGIKSSGSHKERRQRLWLHLNYDSRRMTIENLAEMNRDDLHEMCKSLELELTGNRTVLMGRVAGVLTSQMRGWGRIKRSLKRNGIPTPSSTNIETREKDAAPIPIEAPHVDFQAIPSQALLEDSGDSLLIGIDNQSSHVQGDLLTIHARVGDLERMVGTILRSHGGSWGEAEKDLLLRLADRRGWPIDEQFVRHRVLMVATNIAEVKGASMASDENTIRAMEDAESTIERIRSKLSSLD
ncbi:MAG TPA: hypothetical protein D7H77_03930 [Candidatus Poseidoniales archaeon]|jgi:hypothetical protein|nr:MAG TPA: hypothetical protein D7H77_03930 [Candidatus Poseidoniales archaeon]HIH67512.1 hypothetical protein [Candidatus Thalassarchaeaceae archaeon]|tara:strand:+ start:2062 stop:2994 length:933 start_codon:yes stop_codon:yes gene_type:complete